MNRFVLATVATLLFADCLVEAGFAQRPSAKTQSELPALVTSFVGEYCVDCHQGPEAENGFQFVPFPVDWQQASVIKHWEAVERMVARGVMPPPDSTVLEDEQRRQFVDALRRVLLQREPLGTTGLRRLSRREYVNTVRTLFGLPDFEVADSLPAERVDGIDNIAAEMVTAPAHLQGFAATAVKVADEFFAPPSPLPASTRMLVPAEDLVISYSSACLIDGAMRLASSGKVINRNATWPNKFEAPVTGTYKLNVKVSSAASVEMDDPVLLVSMMNPNDRGSAKELHRVAVPPNELQDVQLAVRLSEGSTVCLQYVNSPFRYDDKKEFGPVLEDIFLREPELAAAWKQVGDPARGGSGWIQVQAAAENPSDVARKMLVDEEEITRIAQQYAKNSVKTGETLVYKYFEEGPYLAIHEMEIEGPFEPDEKLVDQQIARRRNRMLGVREIPEDESAIRVALATLLESIFRRQPSHDELDRFTQLILQETAAGRSATDGWHLALRTALVSPSFLYRNHAVPEDSPDQFAERLAYFLTSNPADRALILAAREGRLKQRQYLQGQLTRLTKERFFEDFSKAWLRTDAVSALMPDQRLVKEFSSELRGAIAEELPIVLQDLFIHNRSVLDLIAPDQLLTPEIVAKSIHQLDVNEQTEKVRVGTRNTVCVRLPIERFGRLGGVLCSPAAMMATANGVDTQPVRRGVWVMEAVLGRTVLEPPNAVPALTPETAGSQTIRQRMVVHQQEDSCAICHKEIDPLGFVLESFDPIGRWRETYPQYKDVKGKTLTVPGERIDASGMLPDGTALSNVSDLKRWIYEHPKGFVSCLLRHMAEYGCGRRLNYREREIIRQIVIKNSDSNYRIRDLMVDLILSPLFQ